MTDRNDKGGVSDIDDGDQNWSEAILAFITFITSIAFIT
jgi:hypothetical protein